MGMTHSLILRRQRIQNCLQIIKQLGDEEEARVFAVMALREGISRKKAEEYISILEDGGFIERVNNKIHLVKQDG